MLNTNSHESVNWILCKQISIKSIEMNFSSGNRKSCTFVDTTHNQYDHTNYELMLRPATMAGPLLLDLFDNLWPRNLTRTGFIKVPIPRQFISLCNRAKETVLVTNLIGRLKISNVHSLISIRAVDIR